MPREYPATCGRHSHAPPHCVLLLQHKEEAQLLRAGEVRLQEDETTCSLLAQLHRAGLQLLAYLLYCDWYTQPGEAKPVIESE